MAGSALFTAVTGLQSFQRQLDVIASNIANVNTTGYRGARVLFQDLFSQTISGGSAPSGSLGSTNSQQIGLGVAVGSIDISHAQGSLSATGVASDLAIQGNGFFILSPNGGATQTFTRDGSFSISTDGYLADASTGLYVQGYPADIDGVINTDLNVERLSIPVGGNAIVQATSVTNLVGNLSSDGTSGDALAVPPVPPTTVNRNLQVFDSLGTPLDIDMLFTKVDQLDFGGTLYNAWTFDADFLGTDVTNVGGGNDAAVIFDENGQLVAIGETDGTTFTAAAPGTPTISIPIGLFPGPSIPDTAFEFSVDFTEVTELSGDSELTNPLQNGFSRGVLQDYIIGNSGLITGVYTNGLTRTLGQVALASFANLGGLERVGSNQFRETTSSGNPLIGISNAGGRGSITGGALESSNVDLGSEFSNMIVTQRAFQANARTITTADSILQETVNLIR